MKSLRQAPSSVSPAPSLAGGAAAVLASLVPWWDDLGPMDVRTHLPKVFYSGALLALLIGVLDFLRLVGGATKRRLAWLAAGLMGIGMVGFYTQVDNSEHFAEVPFTQHVRPGVFIAWAAIFVFVPRLFMSETGTDEPEKEPGGVPLVTVLLFIAVVMVIAILLVTSGPNGSQPSNEIASGAEETATDKSQSGRTPENDQAVRFPDVCLRSVDGPEGFGHIATADNRTIQIGTPSSLTDRLPRQGPISWSPSGRYLAMGGGDVYDMRSGEVRRGGSRLEKWGWSPIADCLVGTNGNGTLVVIRPSGERSELLSEDDLAGEGAKKDDGRIEGFDFANDGKSLEVMSKGGAVVVNLRNGRVVPRSASSRRDFAADECPKVPDVASESCSDNERFVVGIRNDRLVLVLGNGTKELTDGAFEDRFPEWGPSGTGVLFLRRPNGTDRVQLWLHAEGDVPRRTPLSLPSAERWEEPSAWVGVVDWSSTPPEVSCDAGTCSAG